MKLKGLNCYEESEVTNINIYRVLKVWIKYFNVNKS